jgi:S1-C subfamily serine protease
MALLLAAHAAGFRARAAADTEAGTLATALKAEEELTQVIKKAAAAFVFVGGGSGIVVSPDGYILTNHHVAGDRKQMTVRIQGTSAMAVCDLVGTDPVGDLTLLKARDARDLPYVEFGDMAKVRVGQQVLAVGDPFKLAEAEGPPSFSIGTISALHRFQNNYSDAIQTDAAVNPGNSGGPLLTLEGRLIGITGQIMSRFGAKANTGIGYAIPIDQIARFYPLLREAEGRIVYHGALPDGLTFTSRTDETQVAQIESVDPKSGAEKAGFKAGDRVVSVDGKRVYNYPRLIGIIGSYPENTVLDVQVERGGKLAALKIKLPRKQLPPGPAYVAGMGMKLEQTRGMDGLRVAAVDKNSAAEKAGLLAGDVVVSIDGKTPAADWHDLLSAKKPGETLDIRIRRSVQTGMIQKALTLTVEGGK